MSNFTPISALAGGALIGSAAVLLMWGLGRTAGISGITFDIFERERAGAWRWFFLIGLVVGAAIIFSTSPVTPAARTGFPLVLVAISGFLVGFGTRTSGGCTSGHGVCGLARLSVRSLTATITFMVTGAASVYLLRHVFGVGA
jgi:uncharacterized membrane protein YedE/YeeE